MLNDASHHHVHVSRHQPDANEYKENDDRLTSTSIFPSSSHTFDENEQIPTKNDRKRSLPQTSTTTTASSSSTRDEKFTVAKEMPLLSSASSLPSSNPIKTATNNVQSDNNNSSSNDVSSLNHHIISSTTPTTISTSPHSISSDVSSSTRRFIPSTVDQQSNIVDENDGSLPATFPSSSLLMHEQANHANDKYFPKRTSMNNDLLTKDNPRTSSSSSSQQPTSTETSNELFLLISRLFILYSLFYFGYSRQNIISTFFSQRNPETENNFFAFRRHPIIT